MNRDLNDTLEQLARAHGVAETGMGNFLRTLDKLERIERQFDRAIRNSLKAFSDPQAMGRKQAD